MADIKIPDSAYFYAGAGPDLKIRHDGTNSAIRNDTGTFTINNYANTSMILATNNTTALTITNGQAATFANNITIPAGNAFFLDGGGNSKIEEFATDKINIQAGGDNLVIDGSGSVPLVGIGTTSPLADLTIAGNSTKQLHLNGTFPGISNNVFYNNATGAWDSFNHSATGASLGVNTDGSFDFRRATAADPPVLSYSMYIGTDGKVGIGTVSPVTALDVHSLGTEMAAGFGMADDGDAYISVRTAETQNNRTGYCFTVGSAAVDGFGSANATAYIASHVKNDGGTLQGDLQFYTNSGDSLGSAKMTIEADGTTQFAGTTTFQSNTTFAEYLKHDGDSDTYFRFSANNNIEITAGSHKLMRFEGNAQEVVINEDQTDIDFRVETQNASHTLFCEGSSDRVGIGTSSPGQLLEVANSGNAYLAINANLGGGGTDNAGLLLQEHQNDMWTIRNEGNSSNRLAILDEQFDDGVIMAQGGTGFSDVSDERVKTNLVTIADAVDKIKSLRAVNFKWKYGSEDRRTKNNVGIIAQDVYKVLPEAVTVPKDDYEVIDHPKFDGEKQAQNMWTVDKGKLVPLLIKAVQELSAKVEALENG